MSNPLGQTPVSSDCNERTLLVPPEGSQLDALRRFEVMAEHTRDIILLVKLDGEIADANPAAVRAYQLSREELIGLNVRDLREPATRRDVSGQMERADTQTILFESVHCRKDGSTFPVEVSSQGADIGGERLLVSVVRDITERKRAEEETRSTALFAQQNPSPVLRVSKDGILIFCNPASRSLLAEWGCSLGQPAPAGVREAVAAAIDRGFVRELEIVCGARELAFVVSPIPGGNYANLYGFDITERKRTQRLLAEAKSRQELLSRLTGRLLVSSDPQGIIDELALEVMHALGCDVFFNFLVDAEDRCLRLNACSGIAAEDARRIQRLEFGAAVCGYVALHGERVIAEDIQHVPDPRTALIKSYGIQAYCCHPLTGSGKVIGTLSFGSRTQKQFPDEDIALMQSVAQHIAIAVERMQVQKRLRSSEQRYRTIAQSIPDGAVWAVDTSLRFLVAEGSLFSRFGYSPGDLEGRLLHDAVSEDARASAAVHFRAALAGETADYYTEFRGRTIWSQYVPLRDETGRVVAAMALLLDVTERKRMEHRLLQSQKMESVAVLAGGIAHDFNNLLVGILGNASLAQEMLPPTHAVLDVLREVVSAGECAAHLTRQMLAYAGKGRFVIEPVNLSTLVREILVLVRPGVPKHVALDLDLSEDLPTVDADCAQIQQIVMNLVINAGEAITGRDGLITIRTRQMLLNREALQNDWPAAELPEGIYICLEVSDNGCGMDENTKARIFDPFFTTKFTGRGLGLAAVSGIVRGHRGSLRVESTPGAGSLFSIIFPASAEAGDRAQELSAPAHIPHGPGRILVVDDENLVRQVAKSLLERVGYAVTACKGGAEAVDILKTDPGGVDLILLDLSMPGMSGLEALQHLRAIRPDIRVVMSSGYNESECRRMLHTQPVSGFLQKPYTLAMLEKTIEAAINSRPAAN